MHRRLANIEAALGLNKDQSSRSRDQYHAVDDGDSDDDAFRGIWAAAAYLQSTTRPPKEKEAWSHAVVKKIWLS